MTTFYTNSSEISVGGKVTPYQSFQESPLAIAGTFNGLKEIQGMYAAMLNCYRWPAHSLTFPNTIVPANPSSTVPNTIVTFNFTSAIVGRDTVNSTFDVAFNSFCVPLDTYVAQAYVTQEWVFNNGVWTIQKENWDFQNAAINSPFSNITYA